MAPAAKEGGGPTDLPFNQTHFLGCVGGIYASFLLWGWLQERLTKSTYGADDERFTFITFLNLTQYLLRATSIYPQNQAITCCRLPRGLHLPSLSFDSPLFVGAIGDESLPRSRYSFACLVARGAIASGLATQVRWYFMSILVV